MNSVLLGWVATAYLLASAVFLVPCGKGADLYGRKRFFTCGILIFTLSSIGTLVATSPWMLIGSRVLQGIGTAGIYSIGAAILTSVYPSRELGKVLGINLAAVQLGFSTGPFLGGFLTGHFGWRSIFIVNAVMGLTVLVWILLELKGEWRQEKEERFDLPGSIIFSLTLFLVIYGFSQLSKMLGVWLILLGLLGVFVFVKWEGKTETPVLNIDLFRNNRVFAFSNLATLIHFAATFALTFLLSLYLQYIKRLTPVDAGLILISQPIVQAFLAPLTGKISDRIEPRLVASVGMALTAVGLFVFTFLDNHTSQTVIVTNLVLLGVGCALFSSPNTNAVMSSVESRYYGVASGALGTMRVTGMTFSMGMTMLLFSLYIGKVQITPATYLPFLKCVRLAFTLFTGLCLAGMFASLARGKVR